MEKLPLCDFRWANQNEIDLLNGDIYIIYEILIIWLILRILSEQKCKFI